MDTCPPLAGDASPAQMLRIKRGKFPELHIVPIVQWIERRPPKPEIKVRLLLGAQKKNPRLSREAGVFGGKLFFRWFARMAATRAIATGFFLA